MKLDICTGLFEEFHEQGVSYCQWKSNEHLREGLTGGTDLDIIVDQPDAVERILLRHGFKRFDPSWFVAHPGLEDYIGYDTGTGTLVHIHLHHRLAIGNKRLKDYHLPWAETLLKRRLFNEEHSVYTADPAMEMLLLLVRYALKIQKRDYVKSIVGEYLDEAVVCEYEWLQSRTDSDEVRALAAELISDEAAEIVASMVDSQPGLWQFHRLRAVCTDELSMYRTYGYLEAQLRGFLREAFLGFRSLNKRYAGRPRFYRRTVPSGGVQIVLLGVDGAGKSTIIEELDEWLSWKIDVLRTYYGSGDGPATRLRYPIILARSRIGGGEQGHTDPSSSERSLVLRVGRVLRGLVLARERKIKLRNSWRAKSRGLVVLGDRYPQNQIMGFNDGPLLDNLLDSSSWLLRVLARRERSVYQSTTDCPPELVIKLDVSPEVARDRKPEMPIAQLERRVEAIESLEFDTDVVVVDAEQPLEDVLLEVKRHVWEQL